jgi:hypothetical protein
VITIHGIAETFTAGGAVTAVQLIFMSKVTVHHSVTHFMWRHTVSGSHAAQHVGAGVVGAVQLIILIWAVNDSITHLPDRQAVSMCTFIAL